jgi:hypothetical protein
MIISISRTAGDWRQFGVRKRPRVSGPHNLQNVLTLNFARTNRRDLDLLALDAPPPLF